MFDSRCCFTGHRILPDVDEVGKKLHNEIQRLILGGIDYFICGGAYGFDILAGEIVLGFRQSNNIFLELALPHMGQEKAWSEDNKKRYRHLLQNADVVNFISEKYYEGCMQKRNRYMVDNSDYCVAYLNRMHGGTFYTVKYALENGKQVINLALDNSYF